MCMNKNIMYIPLKLKSVDKRCKSFESNEVWMYGECINSFGSEKTKQK